MNKWLFEAGESLSVGSKNKPNFGQNVKIKEGAKSSLGLPKLSEIAKICWRL